jgi:hypothetical protein
LLVIARSTISDLIQGVNEFAGPLSYVSREVSRVNTLVDGEPLISGCEGQWAFLFDMRDSFISMMYTPLLNISRKLQTSIMSLEVDDSCNSVEFFYAEEGEIRRFYLQRPDGFTKPYSTGTPLESETLVPIGAPEGAGLTAILRSVGFNRMDFSVGFHRVNDDRVLLWKGSSDLALTEELPLDFPEHVEKYGVDQPERRIGLKFRVLTDNDNTEN